MYSVLYYVVSAGLLTLLIQQCRSDRTPGQLARPAWSDAGFVSLVLLTLAFMRLPGLFYNQELNPDESQTLAQVIALAYEPVYGRLVDGTTLGPVNAYLLLIPRLLGLPTDYISARLMALLLIGVSLTTFYYALLRLVSPVAGRLTLLVVLVFFGWSISNDYLHYSSELTSLAIITSCVYLTIRLFQSPSASPRTILSLGAIAGLTPYCKLQTLPIVGMILLVAAGYLLWTQQPNRLSLFSLLSAAVLLPNLLIFGLAYRFNVTDYFINFYFIGNLATYSQIYTDVPLTHQSIFIKLLRFPLFSLHNPDFFLFIFLNSSLVLAMAVGIRWSSLYGQIRPLKNVSWTTWLILLTATATLWSVVAPGTEFGHHLVLLVFPMGWLTGLGIQYGLDNAAVRWSNRVTFVLLVLLGSELIINHLFLLRIKTMYRQYATGVTPPVTGSDLTSSSISNPSLYWFPDRMNLTLSPVTQTVNQYAVPTDKIAVWGWNCRYYVETQLVQGVSESHTQRSIVPNQMRDQYLSRYAHELLTNQPVFFLDAVGKSSPLLTKPHQRHEHFPGIDRIIRKYYYLASTVDDVRIFVRRDRLSSQHPF